MFSWKSIARVIQNLDHNKYRVIVVTPDENQTIDCNYNDLPKKIWEIYDKKREYITRMDIQSINKKGQTVIHYRYTTPELLRRLHKNNPFHINQAIKYWKTFNQKQKNVYTKILLAQMKEFIDYDHSSEKM